MYDLLERKNLYAFDTELIKIHFDGLKIRSQA